jgi:hypothetical protein
VPPAPVQPYTKPCSSGRQATQTKQPDHRFAPSRRCRLEIHGWCAFDFKTSLRLILEV